MIDYVDEICSHISQCSQCWANADGGIWCYGCEKCNTNKEVMNGRTETSREEDGI